MRSMRATEPPAAKAENVPSGQPSADSGLPSWATLGLLIRELSFLQVHRRAVFERCFWGVPTDPWLDATAPMVAGHPYRALLGTFSEKEEVSKQARSRLAEADPTGMEGKCQALWVALGSDHAAYKFMEEISRNEDYVVYDIVVSSRNLSDYSNPSPVLGKWLAQTLGYASPDSPLARAMLVQYDWEGIQPNLKQWVKTAAAYPRLSSVLGEQYANQGRLEDAEKCLRAAIKVVPSDLSYYEQLAYIYKQSGQTDRWLETLEECLKQPAYGLEHYSVRADIAQHFMNQRQWEKALPYAEGAAESYAGWGLLRAAECHEALQHWSEAEKYNRACSERYPSSSLGWYLFCRRTGEGDLTPSRDYARAFVAKMADRADQPEPFDLMAYYLLDDQPEKALAEIEKSLGKNPNAYDAIFMALIADQLKDTAKRDTALNRARILGTASNEPDAAVNGVTTLANLLIKDLSQGGNGQINLAAADKLSASVAGAERNSVHFLLARYFHLHGQRDAADRYAKRCMGWPRIGAPYRTLAGAMLVEHGIKPAEYRSLVEGSAEEDKKP